MAKKNKDKEYYSNMSMGERDAFGHSDSIGLCRTETHPSQV